MLARTEMLEGSLSSTKYTKLLTVHLLAAVALMKYKSPRPRENSESPWSLDLPCKGAHLVRSCPPTLKGKELDQECGLWMEKIGSQIELSAHMTTEAKNTVFH